MAVGEKPNSPTSFALDVIVVCSWILHGMDVSLSGAMSEAIKMEATVHP